MRFGVLGPVAVWDADGEAVRVPETKVRALLADLLVHEGQPVSADRLVHDIWGDAVPGNPANALQAKVSQLRRAVGRDRVLHHPAGYRLRLDDDPTGVDAGRFRQLAARARLVAAPRARAALLGEALDLWRGPAYADFADEEFVRPAAQRLTEERLTLVEEQAEARLEFGDPLLLGDTAGLVTRHPLRERLRAVRMRALYGAGRQSEAVAAYTELRTLLADELGLDPSPGLAALYEAILRQDTGLIPVAASDEPPVAVRSAPEAETMAVPNTVPPVLPAPLRQNLPTPPTTLVGRGPAREAVVGLVRAERLVTLTGPGGVGKTRLALAVAEQLARDPDGDTKDGDVPDGVWFVEFGGLRADAAELVQAVAAVLGIRDTASSARGTEGASAALHGALRDRRVLLVLDNCEHVIEPAAELAASLLRSAPGVRVLATSRESLRLPGEAVYAVAPLGPDDAAQLFTERAVAAAPDFASGFDSEDDDEGEDKHEGEDEAELDAVRDAVAEICRRLDGLPLALELAATRVRALGVRELAARLGDRFRVLASGQRGLPARQQTLRAVIDWSWDLLAPPEQAVLRRLAVPVGGCTLDAAETVCAGDGIDRDEVVDLVGRLVDRSLVSTTRTADGPRYRLLESVAAYARERLHEAGEAGAVADRHADYYRRFAEAAETHLRGAGQRRRLTRLDAESANIRAALDHGLRTAESRGAARLAAALCPWWLLRGRLHEARRTLATVVDAFPADVAADASAELRVLLGAFTMLTGGRAPETDCPEADIADPARRGRALWLFAYGLHHAGDPAAAHAVNSRALEGFSEAGDRWGTAAARALRAHTSFVAGDLRTAREDGLDAAVAFRDLGDGWGELLTVPVLAALAEIEGDYAAATARQTEGLRLAEGLGLAVEASARLGGLGRLALLAGDWERARDLHERARRAAAEQGHMYGEVFALMGLALGARRSGDLDAAEHHLRTMLDAYPSSDAGKHLIHVELGFVAALRGQVDRAASYQSRGLEFAERLADPRALALSLEGFAGVAAVVGGTPGFTRAALLLGAADAARRSVGAPLPEAESADVRRTASVAVAALGESAYATAFHEGAALPLAEAVCAAASGA
ncbi:BTAD domain-containing putative transcriptional regulator [Streptomyces sp. WAC01280]|uniref:AfsR/SARP family transcriptional regulator n=1 Tax=Streptomyces sp. WAC01280 TaxID=2487424 RepID=UPI00163BD825|nr:BTAD domain-containing putative transcriptional regulator [Streptomyces sp. WAC01280]